MKEIIIAVLSGAIGGSIITAIFDVLKEKRKSKVDSLRNQIDKLYAPLYMLVSHSTQYLDVSKTILHAHDDHFSGNEWSQDAFA